MFLAANLFIYKYTGMYSEYKYTGMYSEYRRERTAMAKGQTDEADPPDKESSPGSSDSGANAVDTSAQLRVADGIKEKWEKEQNEYKKQLIIDDVEDWSRNWKTDPVHEDIKFVGGVDISFVKGDNINACAAFVVLKFPELTVVYEDLSMVQLTAPYIPGFLAFREADFLVDKIEKLRREQPDMLPQVTLVDGNGILHPRGFGLASQLGVICDIATIGVAKNFYHVDGMEKDEEHQKRINSLQDRGDTFDLIGVSGTLWGKALRTSPQAIKPVFVSPGHKVSVDTAVAVVHYCAKFRVPEPTRQADMLSREYIRVNWKPEEKDTK